MANDRTNMVSLLDLGKWMGGTASNILELGDGVTELTEDWAPEMSEVQYVNMKTKSNTLNGYAFSTTVEREHMSDEAQEFIDDSFRKFPTGKDAETFYYRFYKTDKTTDGTYTFAEDVSGTGPATFSARKALTSTEKSNLS